jgi:hypothetical protein
VNEEERAAWVREYLDRLAAENQPPWEDARPGVTVPGETISSEGEATMTDYGDTPEERLRELTETGKSIRYTGKPMFTMIREALETLEADEGEGR